ncbi:hypothetical protein CAPTEDRAFT_216959 [Capitella teleta]|uniref:THAP-type domain-containing protein n=1 Tax=Capitella teleta TaxID=283909 RepID=R7T9X4_CAPTE|nr:hypothetical protein CAPTEDRAFT_216959 [Capitella teleta]|eukprot:ELT88170.1 hypothetical protein CAPTEDRAFT_216959 [Capitella teleta]
MFRNFSVADRQQSHHSSCQCPSVDEAALQKEAVRLAEAPQDYQARLWWIEHTHKTVCNSLLELMTVSAQLGFNSWGFNNSMHRKKSIHPQPVLMKWDIAVREAAFYEVHRLKRIDSCHEYYMLFINVAPQQTRNIPLMLPASEDFGHLQAKRDNWDPSKFSVLCCVHFKEDDFPLKYRLPCYTDITGVKGRRLLPEAVPTIHVTQDDVESSPTIMNQFEDSAEVEEATLASGEKRWKVEFPKSKRGDYMVRERKFQITHNYVTRLQAAVVDRVLKGKKRARKRAPAPLCASFERPDKRQAIEEKETRSRFNKT